MNHTWMKPQIIQPVKQLYHVINTGMTTESILQSKAKILHRALSYYSFKFVKKFPNCDERLMEAKDMLSKSYFTRLYNEEIFMYKIESLLVSFCRSSTRIL